MALEVKVSSFNRQVVIALAVFAICATAIVLVKLTKRSSASVECAERVFQVGTDTEVQKETVVERDVEVNLLEPLLLKLGFQRRDWTRQLPVRIGRGEKTFPDYAIKVAGEGEDVVAKYVWEAKYSIASDHQLRSDFNQVRSYALLLQSKALCLVSKEGIWFEGRNAQFEFDLLRHFTWDELTDDRNLLEVKMCFRP